MKDKILNLIIWLASSVVLVLADQYTKILAATQLKEQSPFVIIKGVFELFYSENRGAAFGMLQGKQGFFFVIGMFVLGVAVFSMCRMPGWSHSRYHGLKLCIILITAGALGNMIDRISQGYVVDFFYFRLINFPIFNVADIYVTVATAILLILLGFYYREEDLDVFRISKKEEQH